METRNGSRRYRATDLLTQAIRQQGLRQDWIADRAGVSEATVSRLLRGQRTVPEIVAMRIAALVRVPFLVAFERLESRNSVPAEREAIPA